jgi:hypothetical protein
VPEQKPPTTERVKVVGAGFTVTVAGAVVEPPALIAVSV